MELLSALGTLPQFVFAFALLNDSSTRGNDLAFSTIVTAIVNLVLYVVLAWLLLARTDWLADQLRIGEQEPPAGTSGDDHLRLGIQLIGVYVATLAIPGIVRAYLPDRGGWAFLSESRPWFAWVPGALQLALGTFLMFRADVVARVIAGRKPAPAGDEGELTD